MENVMKQNDTFFKSTLALLLALLFMFFFGIGCDDDPSEMEDYDPEAHLTAFLANGQPTEPILLEWVGKFHKYYSSEANGITNATIVVYPVLEADGSEVSDTTGRAFYYHDDPERAGRYLGDDAVRTPEPLVRYRITVVKGDEVELWAETTVPGDFEFTVTQDEEVVNVNRQTGSLESTRGDTLTRKDPELVFDWTESESAEGYQIGILALNDREDLIPLDPEFDPTDPEEIEDWEGVSAYFYGIAPDYMRHFTLAWIYMLWAGPTRLDITACSKEYYDYIFTTASFAGDQKPLMNVHGGLGIFGATAQHSIHIVMERL